MPFDPDTCCRRSIRLKGYDYSQPGSYFVTVCTHARECLLGEIFDGEMTPNEAGRIVRTVWEELPDHYACVVLDGFVIMPNHVHGIVAITDDVDARADGQVVPGADRAGLKPAPTIGAHAPTHADNGADSWRTGLKPAPAGNKRHGLPEIVRAFKTFTSRRINESRGTQGLPVWQRNFYEHIIRNDKTLTAVREYIESNPSKWQKDLDNPNNVRYGAGFNPAPGVTRPQSNRP